MGAKSKIEWTEATWNPIRGCTRVSEGCRHCYAEAVAARFSGPGQPYEGLAIMGENGPRWTGKVRLIESALNLPLRWRTPRRIFVNSMSDLFHESLPFETILRIYGVMLRSLRDKAHIFQILTKRPERMREFCTKYQESVEHPNIWHGVSVEDQKTADERIPVLLKTPSALRWVSYEPALGPVDFQNIDWNGSTGLCPLDVPAGGLHWIVVGGESGRGARPFYLEWARTVISQCKAAGVPCFVKQLGARPLYRNTAGVHEYHVKDSKGGDPSEWMWDLRVREFPRLAAT